MVEKKKTKKKSPATVVNERVLELCPLVSFLSPPEIFRYVSESTAWKVSERQIENYIRKAKEVLKTTCEERKKSIRSDAYNNYVNLFKKSFMIEDYRTCLSIQARIDSIFGLDKPEEITIQNEISFGGKSAAEGGRNHDQSHHPCRQNVYR